VLHIGDGDICSPAMKGLHCCVSMATLSIFFTLLLETDVPQQYKGTASLLSAATTLKLKRHVVTLYILCLSSSGSHLRVLPYKTINQAKYFVCHNIFKLVQLI
jgi:hypothetical protein